MAHQYVIFDHVKRIDHSTTIGAHVYDLVLYKVMTICVCDMKLEMTEHQKQMCRLLLVVMKQHGCNKVEFVGFMADNAHANFNAVREIFSSGDETLSTIGKESTCQFHWLMALDQHTRQHIKLELQAMYKRLCHEYQKCRSKAAANTAMKAIKASWFSSVEVSEKGLKEMNDWMNFWHFGFHQ